MKIIKRVGVVLIALIVGYLIVTQIAYWCFQYNLNQNALIRAKQFAARIKHGDTNSLQQLPCRSNEQPKKQKDNARITE